MAVFKINFMAETLGRTVPLTVILPTDKSYMGDAPRREEGKPYKTLYLLHGIIGDDTDWLYGTRIARWATDRDLCVVMPSGENMCYIDQPWTANYFGEYIGQELVEFTRKTFPLSHKREDTYIGGLSMGGYGAIRNGLKYSDTFGAIVALSAALIVDETLPAEVPNPRFPSERQEWKQSVFGADLNAALQSDKNPKVLVKELIAQGKELPSIFMACGTEDFLLEKNEDFAKFLKEQGVPFTYVKAPGGHEWDFWDTHIKEALEWLPLEEGAQGRTGGNVGLGD